MRIVIMGAGAMGCLFGAWLSRAADVTLLDVSRETVDSINTNGVKVEQMDGTVETYRVRAIADSRHYEGKADIVIFFTKSYATLDAARSAESLAADDGLFLTLQNGVGNLERIGEILGPERGIAGVTAQAGTSIAPGHARHAGAGDTLLGSSTACSEKVVEVKNLFEQVGVATRISDDTQGVIWGKLIVNVGINGLAAILRVKNGVLAEVPACREIMESAVEEAVQVAAGLGIKLPYDDPMAEVVRVCEQTAANRASMLQDTLRNAPTEIDVINQAIVDAGRKLSIPTPTNDFITRMIRALEATGSVRVRDAQ